MTFCHFLRMSVICIIDKLFERRFDLSELTDVIFPANNIFVNSSISQSIINEFAQYYNNILSFLNILVTGLSKFGLNIFLKNILLRQY